MKRNGFFGRSMAVMLAFLLAVSAALPVFGQAQSGTAGKQITLPSYFNELTAKGGGDLDVGCVARRDDLAIEISAAPAYMRDYARLVSDLKLKTAEKGDAFAVKAPFTLRFTYGGRTDTFSFSTQGVRYNGGLYLPGNPGALGTFYGDDHQKFFSDRYYNLGTDLDVSAEQVASVELSRGSYFDEISTKLTAHEPIAALLAEHKGFFVRRLAEGDRINPPSGGHLNKTVYTLRDGSTVSLEDNGFYATLIKGGQTPVKYEVLRDGKERTQFDALVEGYQGVPQLSVTLGGKQPEKVYMTAFNYGGETKKYENDIPLDSLYGRHVYLPVGGANTAKLTFSASASRVTARIHKLQGDSPDAKLDAGSAAAVASDGAVSLPGEPGDYAIAIHAEFPKGTVDYFVSFVVSDLPEFFDDISYGNDEGGVTVTRDDLGRTVTGGQNRQYVSFLQELDLVPAGSAALPTSQIKKPVTLTFRCEGYPDQRFQFRTGDSKIIYNGKEYRARNNAGVGKLYSISDPEYNGSLLDDTMAFLTADITTFGGLYPLRAQDVASIKVLQKRLYQRSVSTDDKGNVTYGFTLDVLSTREVQPTELTPTLKKALDTLLAREGKNADAYDYSEYTAYELTLKDGRRFVLDRRLLVDGKPTGYYIITE